MRLEDKVCYVTGAASGIGAAVSRRFLEEGARVVLVDRNGDLLARVAEELGQEFKDAVWPMTLDVREDAGVHRSIAETTARWSRLDVAVNCAGILLSLIHI